MACSRGDWSRPGTSRDLPNLGWRDDFCPGAETEEARRSRLDPLLSRGPLLLAVEALAPRRGAKAALTPFRLVTSVLSGLPRAATEIRNLAGLSAPTTGSVATLALSPPSAQTTTSACDMAALRHNLPADCWAP